MFIRHLGGGIGHQLPCQTENADNMDVDVDAEADDVCESGREWEANEGTVDMDYAAAEDDNPDDLDTSSDSDGSSASDSEVSRSQEDDDSDTDMDPGPEYGDEDLDDDGFGAL